jgi:DNA polymerase II large subunit
VKVDLPGKAATIAFVDSIECPTVVLRDGSVKRVRTTAEAELFRNDLVKIIDLGDVLVSYGDFLENNKNLPPSPYVPEWWLQDLTEAINSIPNAINRLDASGMSQSQAAEIVARGPQYVPPVHEAIALSRAFGIPLHPNYTPRFDRVGVSDLWELRSSCSLKENRVLINIESPRVKQILENTLVEHDIEGNSAVVSGDGALIMASLLCLGTNKDFPKSQDSLQAIRELSGVALGRQSTTTVGIRIGRPEKAMVRRMKPPVHVLFPVGGTGGPSRDITIASKQGTLLIEVTNTYCPDCNARRFSAKCEVCGSTTVRFLSCPRCGLTTLEAVCPNCRVKTTTYSNMEFDLRSKMDALKARLPHEPSRPIKGVIGLTSLSKTPELIEKGVIRSNHETFVYKDGTLRIDITNAPLTHFRPSDVRLGVETFLKLGYEKDFQGIPLTSEGQLLELKPQDIIIPVEIADDLVRMAQFVDDELQGIYGVPPLYNVQEPLDLVGKTVIGLAPHTSVGVVGRIVGFSATQVCFANPYWHAAKRRDCDGDGDSILLVLDALLNFSLEYVPHQIGGMMDTPLLIQPILLPSEVDEQAHNFDIASEYPRVFYLASQDSPSASSVQGMIERIGSRLDEETQFYGYGFTHPTTSLTIKRSRAAYSTLRTLNEKISKQIDVASKIEAVSTKEVVESIIKTHLIRDIMGNTKKYATQSFKCRKCGLTIRRPPLSWICPKCGGEVRGTLTRASVEKYLSIARRLAKEYDVDPYLTSRLDMVKRELDQLFQGERKGDQLELTEFLKLP